MKTKRLFFYCLLVGTSFLASCSSDEMTDNQVEALPEGMYPLQIASVSVTAESSAEPWAANAPQSRVAENDDRSGSVWQNGDKIKVQIGDGTPGTYTYQNGNLIVADGDAPAYWASKDNAQTIRAWYTSSGSETVNLADQTNDLAYVVKAEKTANFNESVSLTFSHALAKVRVELTGEIASLVANVSIKSYTACTFTQDMLVNGATEGEIKMHEVADRTFEANVCPGFPIEYVKANDGDWGKLTTSVTPEVAKICNIKIEVSNKNVETINLSEQTEKVYTVESGKSVIIDGGGSPLNKRIVIKENAKVMLKNVILAAPSDEGHTINIDGTATLLLSGTNDISCSTDEPDYYGDGNCPLYVKSGTLTINGTDNDKLTLLGGNYSKTGCLGLGNGVNLIINGGNIVAHQHYGDGAGIGSCFYYKCGSITINGGIIKAYCDLGSSGAGIGSGVSTSCGDIIITGGNITATGGESQGYTGASIGSGSEGSCGNITISGNKTVVKVTKVFRANGIGRGSYGSCGTVTIKAGATVNDTKYDADHVGPIE